MSAYRIFDRFSNYRGDFGAAKKESVMDIAADRLDQEYFPRDLTHLDAVKDGASSYITDAGLASRMRRDLALDVHNPREELPKTSADEKMIDLIPNLVAQQIDQSHPADFQANNSVRLLQQSRMHSTEQENMFEDPKAMENKNLYKELPGKQGSQGPSEQQKFSMEGSAAGYNSNRLVDQDGAFLNSVDSSSAF